MVSTGSAAQSEGQEMLEAFTSIGTDRFHVTFTNLREDETDFFKNRTVPSMRYNLPAWMRRASTLKPITLPATEREPEQTILAGENLIIRPYTPPAVVPVQLDDLEQKQLERVRPAAFLTLQTSPGNYQAWVAVENGDREFTGRLKRGTGADLSASGSVRLAGTMNFKRKYMPDFPTVTIEHIHPGHRMTKAQLKSMGLVAPAPPKIEAPASPFDVLTHRAARHGPAMSVACGKAGNPAAAGYSAARRISPGAASPSTFSSARRKRRPRN
jgi:hypothetical protein